MMTTDDYSDVSIKGRPRISACMIAKNEEKFLAQCLKSISPAVDEIILVDTGSTDKTVEIAESFGAKIYHHPWNNDFSEARNYSISYATGDWILYIDPDEVLEQDDISLLHRLIRTNSCNAIYVAIYSEIADGQSKHYYTRILRRGKVHFEGLVHEQPIFAGDAIRSEIRLYHYGYNLPAEEMQKKYERTEALLKRQLEENPKNIFALANLVRNYLNKKEYDTVVEWGERGLAIPVVKTDISSQNQKQRISIDLAQAFLKTNRFDEAEKVSKEALKTHPDFLDNLFQLGNILVGKRAFQEALHYYKKFLHAKENECHRKNFNQLIVDTYEYEHKAYNNIGECYKNVGMLRDAEIAYKKAVELYNRDPIYYANLIDLYILQNRLVEAEELAKSAIRVNIADTWIYSLLGKIFELQNKTDDAVNAFRQAVQKDNKNISVSINLVQLLLQFNRLKEAEEVLKRILMYFPDHVGLMCLMEKLRCKNGDRSNVLRFIQDVLKSKPSDNNVYLGLADLCIEIKDYRMAIEALGRFLENSPNDAKVIANIATCYVKLGNFDSAIMGFQAALAIDPACDLAAKNLSVLKKNYCLQV